MNRAICQCKAVVFIDGETQHKFNSQSTDQPHRCQPQPVPLFEMFNGIKCDRRQDSIARDVTAEALRVGLDPFNVRTVRRGEYLIIKN